MSGHSKWANIRRTKEVMDAKKSSLFTKLARGITVAAKEKGGDPETNFSLRLAIEKAKAANMPKENIEKAIKRGTGEIEGANIEEVLYEGFGPGGSALLIKCLTDNKNRATANLKHLLNRSGGSLGGPNSVKWQFELKGVIRIGREKLANQNLDELQLKIIDLGAQDIIIEEDLVTIFTKISDLQKVKKNLEDLGIVAEYSDIEYVAKEKIKLPADLTQKNQELFDALDENEDVDDYYTNLRE
jgi:YebC/PmpR family DNA-binding regulatory protein